MDNASSVKSKSGQTAGWSSLNGLLICFLLIVQNVVATDEEVPSEVPAPVEKEYRIDQPGTITFTVGVKISGKVEKPQVMIFLPKEKTLYRVESLDRSFREELAHPLPLTPLH